MSNSSQKSLTLTLVGQDALLAELAPPIYVQYLDISVFVFPKRESVIILLFLFCVFPCGGCDGEQFHCKGSSVYFVPSMFSLWNVSCVFQSTQFSAQSCL